ncbi:hypothetical protein JF50_18055 [Pseudoalteromonas luteoviolacea]|uniref:Uncharacterized protein n=1 Tax=Pseudoalteromonas luteoviolacea TaxID=43657 RepID=A0A0C1QMA8_9GAMM|nr:hypothetical protein [Pseudoalteromonas luteoviolacea]KID56182.1 hypothetical protein JF50_18055 [Pseudoalteromonas luteoviolacea]
MNNSNYVELSASSEVDALIISINWEDAFIKESHLYSASYILPSGIVAADSKPTLKLAICLPENDAKVIELRFDEVEEICIFTLMDIFPKILFRHNEIELKLCEKSGHCIRSKKLYYRFLEDYLSSDCSIYTEEDLYI